MSCDFPSSSNVQSDFVSPVTGWPFLSVTTMSTTTSRVSEWNTGVEAVSCGGWGLAVAAEFAAGVCAPEWAQNGIRKASRARATELRFIASLPPQTAYATVALRILL